MCLTLRRLDPSPRDIIPLYVMPTLFSGIAFGLSYVASSTIPVPLVAAVVCAAVGRALYAPLVAVFAPSAWNEMRTSLLKRHRRYVGSDPDRLRASAPMMAAKDSADLNTDASPKAAGRRRSGRSVRLMRPGTRPVASGTRLAWIGSRRQRRDHARLTSEPKGARREGSPMLDPHRAGAGGRSLHREDSVQGPRSHDPCARRRSNRSSAAIASSRA